MTVLKIERFPAPSSVRAAHRLMSAEDLFPPEVRAIAKV